jgi:hypothetical protein
MTETVTVYVALLDEGVNVWRPVKATLITPSVFRLCGPIPEFEVWQFQPGELVRCENRIFAEGECQLTAIEKIISG